MSDNENSEAYKAVERVLTGAVSKILSKYKQGSSSTAATGRKSRPSSSKTCRPSIDNESSDSDDFQPLTQAKKRNKR